MSIPPIRRLALIVVGGVFVAWSVIVVATAAASGSWSAAVTLAMIVLCLAAVVVVGAAVLRMHRRINSLAVMYRKQASATADSVRADIAGRQSELAERVGRLAHSLEALTASTKRLETELSAAATEIAAGRADTAQSYWQLEALLDLRGILRPRAPLPAFRDWAASPDVLHWLVERVLSQRPALVVECGSGASSLVLGYAMQKVGSGKVIALEHDAGYAETSMRRVAEHGLDDVVEIRHAPLTPWRKDDTDPESPWYCLDAVKDLDEVGVVFVDGPPGKLGPLVRYPAFPVLLPHCADDVVFVLDDTVRAAEVEVSDRWLAEYPEFSRIELRADKGMHVFQRRPDQPSA